MQDDKVASFYFSPSLLIVKCDVRQNPTAKLDFTYAVFLRKQKKKHFFS